jgi:hypothetical protein
MGSSLSAKIKKVPEKFPSSLVYLEKVTESVIMGEDQVKSKRKKLKQKA